MKKFLIAFYSCLLILLLASMAHAQDYYMYVRTYDRSGVTKDDDAGRSKAGDVVAILPDTKQFQPSETEKKEYLILKVKDLSEFSKKALLTDWADRDEQGHITAKYSYRKNKIDFTSLTTAKSGIVDKTSVKTSTIMEKVSEKTSTDLNSYETKRIAFLYIQRPIEKLARFILPYAYASTVTSTINKSGEDYNTLTLWEDAKDGDLTETGSSTIQVAECYDDDGVLDEEGIVIDGSTTSADYYMKITAPVGERHSGKLSAGTAGTGFRLDPGSVGWGTRTMSIYDDFTEISWIQFAGDREGHGGGGVEVLAGATIKNCIFYSRGTQNYQLEWLSVSASGKDIYILNNVLFADAADNVDNAQTWYRGHVYVYNNTVNGFRTGYRTYNYDLQLYLKNNLGTNNTVTDYEGCNGSGGLQASATNISSDDTSPDGASYQNKTITYTDAANGDFHTSDADVVDAGTDLGTSPAGVQYDIDNYDRDTGGGSWDIGADEYVAAASAVRRVIFID